MYVSVMRHKVRGSMVEIIARTEAGLLPILRQSPGFIGYYAVDGGDGHAATICLFETQADCESADKKALEWAAENLGEFLEGSPEVTKGDALIVEP